jgi:nucleoside-diphosphate-sugar epimerase
MKYHLVSGACGFVGRNLVKRILKSNNDRIIIVDNLSTGIHPDKWLSNPS